VIVTRTDLEVHLLALYRDLAGNEGVHAILWSDLYGLVDCDLDRSLVEARMTSAAGDLLGFQDKALSGPAP
jgi:hypothetical protein